MRNVLISRLLRGGSKNMKEAFESLLRGGTVQAELEEQIVYDFLDQDENAVWSLRAMNAYMNKVALADMM